MWDAYFCDIPVYRCREEAYYAGRDQMVSAGLENLKKTSEFLKREHLRATKEQRSKSVRHTAARGHSTRWLDGFACTRRGPTLARICGG